MRQSAHLPASRRIGARNLNLAIRKFDELRTSPRMQRRSEALRAKDDRQINGFESASHCEVVAQLAAPRFEHPRIVESLAPNRGAAAPAEVVALLAEHRGDRGVPRRGQRTRKCTRAKLPPGNNPTNR